MNIMWHCKGCGELGETKLKFNEVVAERKPPENLLDTVMRLIPHHCSSRDIGIRTNLGSSK